MTSLRTTSRASQSAAVLRAQALLGLFLSLAFALETEARTISFSGLTWEVRAGSGAPGNKCWSDAEESVWIDDAGNLHLAVRQLPDGRWCQAEVRALSFADYGNHLFQTASRIDQLSDTVVLGMFLYADDYNEIDIEATRAFGGPENLLYVVQPPYDGASLASYHSFLVLNGSYSSHRFDWQGDGSLAFDSWHGHCIEPPCGGLISTWSYDGPNTPDHVELLRPYINLWIRGDDPPAPQEVVISGYNGSLVPRPTTTTTTESSVSTSGATLHALVNANGWESTGWFEYGTSTNYSSSTESHRVIIGNGSTEEELATAVTDLLCGTAYHYRAVAGNVAGFSYGDDRAFQTVACAPLVATHLASEVRSTSATLTGSVNANGASTTVTFEFGETAVYGRQASVRTLSGPEEEPIAIDVAPLECETTYHFRIVATNPGGTTAGEDETFTTASCDDVPSRRRPARPGH